MKESTNQRGNFTGGLGFVLTAAASAVGLGNLWRFPYLVAQYGGGIFILVYIILALTFGFTLMTTEIAIGRKTGKSPIMAYQQLSKKFKFLGYLSSIVPLIILPYYNVIGGWVLRYVFVYTQGITSEAANDSFFEEFIGHTFSPLIFFLLFLAATTIIVIGGVEKSIEKMSKVLMPILILITMGIAIYIMFQPGANEAVKYYLLPDFSKFSIKTVCAAMGQMFYSLSLAMGIMVTYGSYIKKDVNLVKSVNQIEIFDTVIAILSGLMIIPAIYIFSGEAGLTDSGPGLMFVSLPKIFNQIVGGRIIGLVFFILVLFAALTSSVSSMEAIVSCIMDKFKLSRLKACAVTVAISVLLGIPSSLGNGSWNHIKILGMDFLSFFDYISNSILMPIVALCTCIMVGWVIKTKVIIEEVTFNGESFSRRGIYELMIKYIAPVFLIVILVVYTLDRFGIFQI